MRAISPSDFQKWLPRGELLSVDVPAFAKWMLTLAASILIVGAASTGTLNLIANYAVRPAASSAPPPSPAELRSVEPIQIIAPVAAAEAKPAPAAPATSAATPIATQISAADASAVADTTPQTPAANGTSGPQMMATLSLAVRSHPQKASPQVGALQQGEIVTIQGEDGGWYLVTSGNGATGWSWGKYLKPVDPNIAADSPFWSDQGQDVAFAR